MFRKIPASLIMILICASAGMAADEKSKSSILSGIADFTQEKFNSAAKGLKEFIAGEDENSNKNDNGNKTPNDSKIFNKVWDKFSSISNEAIELAVGKNPRSKSMFEFVTLQEPKYVRLIREAQKTLSNSQANELFADIEKLHALNRELNSKINGLKRKRVTAPEKSLNPLTDTRSGIDGKIRDYFNEIAHNDDEIVNLKGEILELLRNDGINLSMDELNYFVISAEGDDLATLMAIAENMKKIQKIIEDELKNDSNNIELVKIYTGMYLVSLDAFATAHEEVIDNISKYRSRLADIRQEAKNNQKESIRLKRDSADSDAANIDSNIRISERTMQVADLYDGLLVRRADNLRESKRNLDKKLQIARNTYRTIANGSALINLVNDGSNDYLTLVNFEMPELKNIYDGAMMEAFSDISEKIRMEK